MGLSSGLEVTNQTGTAIHPKHTSKRRLDDEVLRPERAAPNLSAPAPPPPEVTLTGLHVPKEKDGMMLPCVVKLYDEMEGAVKLNEMVEFWGVLEADPASPNTQMAGIHVGGDLLGTEDHNPRFPRDRHP